MLTEKMWKVPAMQLVLGQALLWVSAAAAAANAVRPADDIITPGVEDGPMTPGDSEEPCESTDWTASAPASTKRTDIHVEGPPTSESTVHAQEESRSPTTSNGAIRHSTADTRKTAEKGGMATASLVGVTVGILVAIGFVGGIITVVV